jgi:hypothetical protein
MARWNNPVQRAGALSEFKQVESVQNLLREVIERGNGHLLLQHFLQRGLQMLDFLQSGEC